MGALIPSFRPTLDLVRGVPNLLGLRPTAVTIETRVWAGGRIGRSTKTVQRQLQLAPPPASGDVQGPTPYYKVRQVTQREIASSGGRYEQGTVVIGPITPYYTRPDGTTGGFLEADLNPVITSQGTEVVYVLTAVDTVGINGEYVLVDLERDSGLHFIVFANRRRVTP